MSSATDNGVRQRIQDALPEYEVTQELGRGAMGVVLAGRHHQLERPVAIKHLPEALASEPDVRTRFAAEARLLASLTHPHVVPIYDYVEREGLCLLVMEALPGGTVWDQFTTAGLSPPTACAIAMVTSAGLSHAHERRVLHRDIKPDNLMFAEDRSLKVTDFGIAKVYGGEHTLATLDGEVLGTPAYMAPEQASGGDLGPASDVFATACMLYELLSGVLPSPETDSAADMMRARVEDDPVPLRDVAPHVPEAIAEVVMDSLQRDPAARPASAEDLGVAIGEAAAFSWGPEWLDRSDVPIITGGRIVAAATRTTSQPAQIPAEPQASEDPATTERTTGDAEARRSRGTTASGSTAPEVPGDPATPERTTGDAEARRSRGTTASGSASPPIGDDLQRSRSTVAHRGGARLDDEQLAPSELVPVEQILTPPPFPRLAFLAAGVLALAMILLAVAGLGSPERGGDLPEDGIEVAGQPIGDGAVSVDLDQDVPITVTGAPPETERLQLEFSAAGVALGKSSATPVEAAGEGVVEAEVDPGSVGIIASGPMTAEVRTLDQNNEVVGRRSFGVDPERMPLLSGLGLVLLLLVLYVGAYTASLTRPLRRGRRRFASFVRLPLIGALAGVTAVVAAWGLGLTEPAIATLLVEALLGAATFSVLGWALFRWGRRRRLERARAEG